MQHDRKNQYMGCIVTLGYLFHSSLLINEHMVSHKCFS